MRLALALLLVVLPRSLAAAETIALEQRGSAYLVPVRLNNAVNVTFVLDTGASDLALESHEEIVAGPASDISLEEVDEPTVAGMDDDSSASG